MDVKKFADILAKGEDDALKGAAEMWRNALADTVMLLLKAEQPVTIDTLRQGLEMQIAESENKFKRATMLGALNVLNGREPRD